MSPEIPDDELDGCELDFSPDAVSDDDLLGVVLGDDAEKFNAYRKLFGNAEPPTHAT